MYIITRQYKTPKVVTEKKLRPSQHEYVYFFKLAHTCLLESAFFVHMNWQSIYSPKSHLFEIPLILVHVFPLGCHLISSSCCIRVKTLKLTLVNTE